MAAINFTALPEPTQQRVANMRRAWWRPVYVKKVRARVQGEEYLLRVIADFEVGSEDYGQAERELIKDGWAMVVGKVAEKETVQ